MQLIMECALRAFLIAAGTAVVLSILRVKSARARHVAWTSVMVLMLVLPVWTVWGPKAPVRVLPATTRPPVAAGPGIPAGVLSQSKLPEVTYLGIVLAPVANPLGKWLLTGLYLLGACVLMARLVIGTARAHILRRKAVNRDGRLTSSSCTAPITVGWLRPVVILPECWSQWSAAQLDAVVAHEREHARRHDPLVQWLALLNRAVFWYHPLAWWLERRLSALAEESCDAAVLARGHDPYAYSEYLLQLARAVVRTGSRVNVLGMAMPGSYLSQRVKQILTCRPVPRMTRVRMLCVASACAMVSGVFAAGTLDRQIAGKTALSEPAIKTIATERRPDSTEWRSPLPEHLVKPTPATVPLLAQGRGNPAVPSPSQQAKDHRMLVLYFDITSMRQADLTRAIAATQKFVRNQMRPDDLVALMTFSLGTVEVKQDFTGDKDQLLGTIEQLNGAKGPDSGEVSGGDPSLTGLRTALERLEPLRAKKALLYFSPGPRPFGTDDQAEVRAAIDAAERANVAIYVIDTRGAIQ
jgi:hypothetical protein